MAWRAPDNEGRRGVTGPTIQQLLEERLLASTVGREAELSRLDGVWGSGAAPVCFVWGLPGAGKSTLLHAWALTARKEGRRVAIVDGRDVDPTPEGLLGRVAGALGVERGALEAAVRGDDPFALCIDHFDALRLVEAWLRDRWLPTLGVGARLILASSTPATAWIGVPGWSELVDVIELGPLEREAAFELLEGLPAEAAASIYHAVGGHPLALRLARALPAGELADLGGAGSPRLLAELSQRFMAALPDESERELLKSASVVRRVTVPVLLALLGRDDVESAYAALSRFPFVSVRADGLHLHDAVRRAVAGTLRAAEPSRYRRDRRAAFAALQRELGAASRESLWRCTADLLYMVDNPAVRQSFFPQGIEQTTTRTATAADRERIAAIAAAHCEPRELEVLLRWIDRAPHAATLIHEGDTLARAFYLALPGREVPRALVSEDVQLRTWIRDAEAREGGRGSALFVRALLDEQRGEAMGPTQAAAWLDVKRHYMQLRPALRLVYAGVHGDDGAEAMAQLGFESLGDLGLELGAPALQTRRLDMGPGSVEGWLAGILADELGELGDELLDRDTRELLLPSGRVPLTALEAGLFGALLARDGGVVTQSELLAEVWGYGADAATSNVVQAVVRTLRKKLGPYAPSLTTVRGVGYRFAAQKRLES